MPHHEALPPRNLSPRKSHPFVDVQDGHPDAEPSRYAAQRVIPHGPVSPDGRRAYPQPSLSAKILVWGGIGIAAAAATAGTVLAARKLADLVTGDEPAPRRLPAPSRPADSRREDEDRPRELSGSPRASDPRPADARTAQPFAAAPRRRRKPVPAKQSFGDQVGDIARSINSVIGAVTAASVAFRSVAAQAPAIMNEFSRAAGQARDFVSAFMPRDANVPGAAPHRHPDPSEGANRDLDQALSRKGPGAAQPAPRHGLSADEARRHRL